MSSNNKDDTSNVSSGETSADYMISESGKQSETKGTKSVLDSATDKIRKSSRSREVCQRSSNEYSGRRRYRR